MGHHAGRRFLRRRVMSQRPVCRTWCWTLFHSCRLHAFVVLFSILLLGCGPCVGYQQGLLLIPFSFFALHSSFPSAATKQSFRCSSYWGVLLAPPAGLGAPAANALMVHLEPKNTSIVLQVAFALVSYPAIEGVTNISGVGCLLKAGGLHPVGVWIKHWFCWQ